MHKGGLRNPRYKVAAVATLTGAWRKLAVLYFIGTAVRLALAVRAYRGEHYVHGAIPIAFHWVLALFVPVWARPRVSATDLAVR
jgi:hypothetical protein